jgi:outer membrane beta-barrel protein
MGNGKNCGLGLLLIGLMLPPAAPAQTSTPVIEPELDRREVIVPRIDATDLEISVFAGILSIEDFGAEASYGARIGYHVTEDFFVEATYGQSTISDQSFFDRGIPIFTQRELDLKYYHAAVGYNLFPGEVFVGKARAFTSAVYVIGGLGNVSFADVDHTAYNFGFGIRVLPFDWLSLRLEARDHIFESDLLGKKEFKHNFEMTFGVGAYF